MSEPCGGYVASHTGPSRARLTVAEDGAVIALMKKTDGQWWWNPFGW